MALWNTVIKTLLIGIIPLCSGNNFLGPRNITRAEGSEQEIILCQSYSVQATPFWKINGTIYYYSDVPPPFVASRSGRKTIIPIVNSTLNGTSFQCFVPSSSGGDLSSSSTGVLTVTSDNENGHQKVPGNTDPQPKIVIIHQNLSLFPNAVMVTWRALRDRRCAHYQLVARQSCDVSSNTMVLINRTKEETIILESEVISKFTFYHLTVYDKQGDQCDNVFLESFQFSPGRVTEDINLCMSGSYSCTATCIEIPALNEGQTLVLALPFLSITTDLEDDLLCPVHPLPGERCVDLLSCNHFRESAYANSITVCRTRNSHSSLEICFHNITDILNGTRLHFFYSDLNCRPNGIQPESTRLYAKSLQLHVTKFEDTLNVAINDSNLCITSECIHQDCTIIFKISIVDKVSRTFNSSQNIMTGGCVSLTTLQMNTACDPYYVTIEAYNKILVYNRSIMGYASDSKCTFYGSQSTRSTQSLAIGVCAIFGLIILILLVFIVAIAHKNYKMFSK